MNYEAAQPVQDISHFEQIMPSVYIGPNNNVNEEEDECMICLLGTSQSYIRTTPCRHLFHKDCLDEWGRKSLNCPTCRGSLARDTSTTTDISE